MEITTKKTKDGFKPYTVYVDGKEYGHLEKGSFTYGRTCWYLYKGDQLIGMETTKKDVLKLAAQ